MQAHYPDFIARLEAEDRPLPEYVREEFETYLRCGVLEHGFLRVVCASTVVPRGWWRIPARSAGCAELRRTAHGRVARHLVDEVFGPRPVRQWC
ncbi:hypothetical protein QM088_27110 [Klebsiella pneumoniae]|nr:hypothetical protein [Klebsiella pneumoniae]MDV5545241.1 hypothetical protein [Klebsiella pneumoniae]